MFSNDIVQLIIFINNLPKEIFNKILLFLQIIFIVFEILAFLYIIYITKDY